jgi:S1-C subfamily serine protease
MGFGSGVAIRADGTIVTNWHVLEGGNHAVIVDADGKEHRRVVFLEGDRRLDIAIVQAVGASFTPADFTVAIPQAGSRVVVIGAPQGLTQTVSDGIVSAVRMLRARQLVQITAPISQGSSGGPVFDKQGRVFAIATAQLVDGQALNFATPIRYAFALLPLGTSPRPIGEVFRGRGR